MGGPTTDIYSSNANFIIRYESQSLLKKNYYLSNIYIRVKRPKQFHTVK